MQRSRISSIAPPPLLTYRTLALAYTYYAPSRKSFAFFFDTAHSFLSNSTKRTAQPSLSHIQKQSVLRSVPFYGTILLSIPFCSLTALRNANACTVQQSLYEDELLVTATVRVHVCVCVCVRACVRVCTPETGTCSRAPPASPAAPSHDHRWGPGQR